MNPAKSEVIFVNAWLDRMEEVCLFVDTWIFYINQTIILKDISLYWHYVFSVQCVVALVLFTTIVVRAVSMNITGSSATCHK